MLSPTCRIDRILVVTFTEKATNELRLRVRAKLEHLLRAGAADADADQMAARGLLDPRRRARRPG